MSEPEAVADLILQQLAELDRAIALSPLHADLHFYRASILAGLGQSDAAKADYLAAIAADPTHFGALNDLGTLLYKSDFRAAARVTYAEAVRRHPDNPVGRINLANALLADGQIHDAEREFTVALNLMPDDPDAHQGMANLLQNRGWFEEAEQHRQRSYRQRRVIYQPYYGAGDPCRVLILVSGVGGNVPTRFLFPETLFAVVLVVVEAWRTDDELPAHDVIFNAIGDADICREALEHADILVAKSAAEVINAPKSVLSTGRADNAGRLAGLPRVHAPWIKRAQRAKIRSRGAGFSYPLLVRSPGFHTGQHFVRVEDAKALEAACAAMPTDEILLIEFLDARDKSGRVRKYRVMFIGGQIFPLHLAISDDWKVHYFTADMAESSEYRRQEETFLNHMATTLGPAAMEALSRINALLGLDYAGIDFGLAEDGSLLLFEANATMVINPAGPEPIWDYRRAPIEHALNAVHSMMLDRARVSSPPDIALQIG